MQAIRALAAFGLLALTLPAPAQLPSQPQIKIDTANRVLTVTASERISVDPELAILHIGFETKPMDAKTAYADGSRTSNAIVSALKQAGLRDTAIRSESQSIEPVDAKNHKFKLVQTWTVRTPPERAAEILDAAVSAGATDSGGIEWTVQDIRSLEDQALDHAAARAHSDAAILAKASGAKLGTLVYLTSQVQDFHAGGGGGGNLDGYDANFDTRSRGAVAPPLAIEPRKVSRQATVYAAFAIE